MSTRTSLLPISPHSACSPHSSPPPPPPRADFSFTYAGHTYLVSETNRTWQAAATNAASEPFSPALQGHLAIIESAAENQAIFSQLLANIPSSQFNLTLASDGGPGSYVWIAANDIAVEGTWVWDGDGTGPSSRHPLLPRHRRLRRLHRRPLPELWPLPHPTTQWEPDNAVRRRSRTPPAWAWPTGPEASPANGTTSTQRQPSGPSSNSTPSRALFHARGIRGPQPHRPPPPQ
jgi:hypothetical protein